MKINLIIVFALVLIALMFFVVDNPSNPEHFSGDFLVHYSRVADIDTPLTSVDGTVTQPENFGVYPPLSEWLLKPYGFRLSFFYLAVLIIFFLVAPLILYFYFRHWFVGLAWFSFSAVWGFTWGTIAQGLATLLFVVFIFEKRIWLRVLLLLISPLLHSHAFWLLASYWCFELVWENRKELLYLGACVLPIPVNKPVGVVVEEFKNNTAESVVGNPVLLGSNYVLVARWFPFNPLIVFSVIGLWRNNKKWLVYSALVFGFGVLTLWFRIVESLVPFFVFGLTYYFIGANKKMKRLLTIACLLIVLMLFLHQLSLFRLIGFSISGSFGCLISYFTT